MNLLTAGIKLRSISTLSKDSYTGSYTVVNIEEKYRPSSLDGSCDFSHLHRFESLSCAEEHEVSSAIELQHLLVSWNPC